MPQLHTSKNEWLHNANAWLSIVVSMLLIITLSVTVFAIFKNKNNPPNPENN